MKVYAIKEDAWYTGDGEYGPSEILGFCTSEEKAKDAIAYLARTVEFNAEVQYSYSYKELQEINH